MFFAENRSTGVGGVVDEDALGSGRVRGGGGGGGGGREGREGEKEVGSKGENREKERREKEEDILVINQTFQMLKINLPASLGDKVIALGSNTCQNKRLIDQLINKK